MSDYKYIKIMLYAKLKWFDVGTRHIPYRTIKMVYLRVPVTTLS